MLDQETCNQLAHFLYHLQTHDEDVKNSTGPLVYTIHRLEVYNCDTNELVGWLDRPDLEKWVFTFNPDQG